MAHLLIENIDFVTPARTTTENNEDLQNYETPEVETTAQPVSVVKNVQTHVINVFIIRNEKSFST